MSDKVKLKGLSAKGKQRVKQWGDTWVVLQRVDCVSFSNLKGNWLFIRSTIDEVGSSSRWVNLISDKDFEVTNV